MGYEEEVKIYLNRTYFNILDSTIIIGTWC